MKRIPTRFLLIRLCSMSLLVVVVCATFSEMHRYFELLSHFMNQYVYCATLLLMTSVMLRRNRDALFACLSLLLSAALVVPFYFDSDDRRPIETGRELKVLLSNVYMDNLQHERVIDYVLQERPDIVVLLEINKKWVEEIKILFDHYPHRLIKAQDDYFGIAVLSKVAVLDQRIVNLGLNDIPSIESVLTIENQTVHLLATHPLTPLGRENYRLRNAQLMAVAARLSEIDSPKLLVGDLNITPWSSDYDILESETGLISVRSHFGVLPTWPAPISFLGIPIDHILVSEAFIIKEVTTGPNIGSDHLPLVATLNLLIPSE